MQGARRAGHEGCDAAVSRWAVSGAGGGRCGSHLGVWLVLVGRWDTERPRVPANSTVPSMGNRDIGQGASLVGQSPSLLFLPPRPPSIFRTMQGPLGVAGLQGILHPIWGTVGGC